eukprot:TRINITY_DN1744_c0_g1_i1.p1 TRINITY_DN1744_c0_g1~~TRINITY_DN1744_c0_g1_i1.p1  ORF type:complete len:531 (-),score=142.55 TRINITY_DN1744_c0_g1_i1:64-1656(-)
MSNRILLNLISQLIYGVEEEEYTDPLTYDYLEKVIDEKIDEVDDEWKYELKREIEKKTGYSGGNTCNASLLELIRNRELGISTKRSKLAHTYIPKQNCVTVPISSNIQTLKASDLYYRNGCVSKRVKRRPIIQLNSQIFCGQFSKSGDVFMSACQDKYIRLFDVNNNWKLKKKIKAHSISWSIIDTAYSNDQNFLVYSSWSPKIHLCNVSNESNLHQPLDLLPLFGRFCVFSLQFSPNTTEILCGASDRHLYLYNLATEARTHCIKAHQDDINTVCYLDDTSNIFVSGSDDTLCRIWDRRVLSAESDNEITDSVGSFIGHLYGVTHVSSKNDGRYFISNSKDQSIKLWDIRKLSDINPDDICIHHNSFDYRQKPNSEDHTFKILQGHYRHKDDQSIMTYRGHSVFHTLIRSYFSPETTTGGRYIYTGSFDNSIYIYDVLTGEIVEKLTNHDALIRDVSWHPYSSEIISTSWDGTHRSFVYVDSTEEIENDENNNNNNNNKNTDDSDNDEHQYVYYDDDSDEDSDEDYRYY